MTFRVLIRVYTEHSSERAYTMGYLPITFQSREDAEKEVQRILIDLNTLSHLELKPVEKRADSILVLGGLFLRHSLLNIKIVEEQ